MACLKVMHGAGSSYPLSDHLPGGARVWQSTCAVCPGSFHCHRRVSRTPSISTATGERHVLGRACTGGLSGVGNLAGEHVLGGLKRARMVCSPPAHPSPAVATAVHVSSSARLTCPTTCPAPPALIISAALDLFEKSWDDLLKMPSRLSAPVDESAQTDRDGLLEKAAKTGYVTGYEAWRVSSTGRRFKIKVRLRERLGWCRG